jgi:LuxR family maltose regulon positive regulatory protein
MLPALINELAPAPKPVILIIEDYHLIGRQQIHEGVNFLIEHLPATAQLVVASRTAPPFPLARRRVQRELREIDAEQLRLSGKDVTAPLLPSLLPAS